MWEYIEGQKHSKIKGYHTYINPVVSHVETVFNIQYYILLCCFQFVDPVTA